MNGPTIDPCEVIETGLSVETGLVFIDSVFTTNTFYLRELNSEFYGKKVQFKVNSNHETEEIRWQIGTDPREFVGQTEVTLKFETAGTIPVRVIAPRPVTDPRTCTGEAVYDTAYTQITFIHHPEPFTEMVGTYRGDSPLHSGETIEFEIIYDRYTDEEDSYTYQISNFPESPCPIYGWDEDGDIYSAFAPMTVGDQRYGFFEKSTGSICGAFVAYFIFSDDQESVRVKFRHRYNSADDWEHFVFEGERVD